MDPLGKLEEIFRHFPGIGPRQAKRFVYHLLTRQNGELDELSKLVIELKQHISVCQMCYRFFNVNGNSLCNICRDANRDHTILMVVSRDIDLQAVDRSRAYNGLYFVLGGTVPILEEHPEGMIRQKELLDRLAKNPDIKEVILATNLNPEGEHTAEHLSRVIRDQATRLQAPVRLSMLGRGLSTGTELEYSDSETLRSALENRR